MYRRLCALGVLAALAAASSEVAALTESGTAGDVRFTVYAPDWTWQKQNVNVLFVLSNQGVTPQDVTVAIELPQGKESHFQRPTRTEGDREVPAPLEREVRVSPGETVRQALTDIRALDGVPRQVYDFTVIVRCGEAVVRVPYSLATVRGAAVSSAKWALFLPVVVALVWSVLLAAGMLWTTERHAWLTPGKPVLIAGEREAWIDQTPL